MNKKRHSTLHKRISNGGKEPPRREGRKGTPQEEYIVYNCALESKFRHSGDMTVDFKVVIMYLVSLSK